jgi:archaellum component FlaG (FlaF/FlaG flagellin family)
VASSVASQVILFIAVISITTGLVAVFNNYVHETTSSTKVQWQYMSNQLKTDVTIDNIMFNTTASPKTTTISVRNTGKTKLSVNLTDIYLDGFISRDDASRLMILEPSADKINPGIWDEQEILTIIVYKDLSASTTYEICITTQYGTRTCDTFSTP